MGRKKLGKTKAYNSKIKLRCYRCGRKMTITTVDKSIYTNKVKKKWECALCAHKNKERK